jgi:hypothetical protein
MNADQDLAANQREIREFRKNLTTDEHGLNGLGRIAKIAGIAKSEN